MKVDGKRNNQNKHFRVPYQKWYNMIQRCYNKNNPYYKNYGAKGITVCDKWKTFEGFLDDFDKIKGFSEEIFNSKKIFLDKDGRDIENTEYNLENCEFINIEESNKRKQHQMKKFFITDEETGKTEMFFNQSDCSKKYGIPQPRISYALKTSGKYKTYRLKYAKS